MNNLQRRYHNHQQTFFFFSNCSLGDSKWNICCHSGTMCTLFVQNNLFILAITPRKLQSGVGVAILVGLLGFGYGFSAPAFLALPQLRNLKIFIVSHNGSTTINPKPRKPIMYRKSYARQQCMYEGPYMVEI